MKWVKWIFRVVICLCLVCVQQIINKIQDASPYVLESVLAEQLVGLHRAAQGTPRRLRNVHGNVDRWSRPWVLVPNFHGGVPGEA